MNEQNKQCPCGASRLGSERCSACQSTRSCGCNGQSTFVRRPWNSSCSECGASSRRRNTCNTCTASDGISGDTVWKSSQARSGCGCTGQVARSGCGCTDQAARSGCGCTGQVARSGCGCTDQAARSGCGCTDQAVRSGCGCTEPCAIGSEGIACLSGKSLAMVYAPKQSFESLYDPRVGLCNGTVFCELNKPFCGSGR